MGKTILKFLPAVGSWIIAGGLEVSGVEIPWLGYTLIGLGGLLLIIPFWPTIRKLQIDGLEVRIAPNKWLNGCVVNGRPVENPSYSITPGHSFSAMFDLILANHSKAHRVHIDSANIVLRKRTLFWSSKPLFSIPVEVQNHPNNYLFGNLDIEARSKKEYSINTGGDLPVIHHFPRRSRLILTIEMVGPMRCIEHVLQEFKHDPKLVPDIPGWKK